ncbi:Uncharacterised protein [Mycobacteroides abscessus subsp. abscessus]|uniref:NUMOD4 domain-containing protein n=1 Tax=Mycobacteroides abscessus subsp. abscessus TaxID=1185650 RepID=A0AB38D0N6_9MYCO|nr:NUMOD4 domain-containing protein [Mycobacteroides abscessus]SHX05784.1 Uncharacterised protein [Mycobacteroides abscessus subsp. abscessus]SIA12815.1 Uncharacterised protein [Mycobacteroides abscessus subsp. abscessus]SIB13811.1 Uncharacterised protein [Mycobacteroides abscessus subsp. abscessus]SIB14982.1 Uncharacterised protein [Mycobacteroides abscessus subsp. abscessus]SIB18977.1 Uncharacterised protein [Mycobacteroides abscessus subsp. abscessus]
MGVTGHRKPWKTPMDTWPELETPALVWKQVPFLEERFQVSNTGQVRTRPYHKEYVRKDGTTFARHYRGRLLIQRVGGGGGGRHLLNDHLYVSIYRGSGRESSWTQDHRVDTLVASAFHGLPYNRNDRSACQLWRVQHLDDDPDNCSAENLKWVHSFGSGDIQSRYNEQLTKWEAHDVSVESFMDRFYSVA